MKNLRIYGKAPYRVAVIHGGPGAPGEMAPVARELSSLCGILEPLQTKATIQGQLEELHGIVRGNGSLPLTLVGHSWGAMLSYLFTAQYPSLVKKLILISSGVFEDQYAAGIMQTRLSRLSEGAQKRLDALTRALQDPAHADKNATFAQLGELIAEADSFDPLPHKNDTLECQYALYESVWQEAAELRRRGALFELGRTIRCPVVAIHGDYDPHPAEGISTPISRIVKDFRFLLLEHCGHNPWYEKEARKPFFAFLKREVA